MKNLMKPLHVTLITIAVGAFAFYGGMQYQKSKAPATGSLGNRQFGTGRQQNGQIMQGGNRMRNSNFGGRVMGEIIRIDGDTVTVKLADESSRIVILSTTTSFSRSQEGSKADVRVGEKIGVFGTENPDKTISAENIQINPLFPSFPTARPNKN